MMLLNVFVGELEDGMIYLVFYLGLCHHYLIVFIF